MSFYLMHRGWMENGMFSDEPFCERLAWIWLIQEASFEPHKIRYKNQMIEVGIGQVPISYRRLVEKWKWGIHRVRNFLTLLESQHMISRETATGFLVITICNYEKYQRPEKISTTQPATLTTTPATTLPTTNIKKVKELKELKERKSEKFSVADFVIPAFINSQTWNAFMEIRKEKGAAQTEQALRSVVNELTRFMQCGHDPNEIIQKSIRNSWKDVYTPKEPHNANISGITTSTKSWSGKGNQLAEKYRMEAEREEQAGVGDAAKPNLRIAENVREDE